MYDTKIITFVKENSDIAVIEKLSVDLDAEFIALKNIQHLFRMIATNIYHTDLIIIDIEQLYEFSTAGLLDVLMALNTLISCSCPLKTNKVGNIPVAVAVTINTDPKLIREVTGTGFIIGVYPSGEEFTLEEKKLAITETINSQLHIPNKIQKILNENKKSKKTSTNQIELTARQQQILNLIIERGASNKLISRMLNISESTVKLHVTQILKKHRLTNRTQLALFAKT